MSPNRRHVLISIARVFSKLFTVVKNGYEKIHDTLSTNVEAMITARSWAGVAGTHQSPLDGILVFEVLTTFYTECVHIPYNGVL